MGLYLESDDSRVTAANVSTTVVSDPEVIINSDIYEQRTYPNALSDVSQNGGERRVFAKAGDVMRKSELDKFFKTVVQDLSPTSGPIAGGTTVTIKGVNLDGVTAVSFDGTAGTSLTVVTPQEVTVVTPDVTATLPGGGPVDVVVTGDDGDHTLTGGYTYV